MAKRNQFERQDDFNPSVDVSKSILEKWIHKQVVKKTGDGEDDFILEEKPVLIDKIDLHKQINAEAKTTDLKYLLKQLMATGDESVLNKKPGIYGDFSGFTEEHTLHRKQDLDLGRYRESLPEPFKKLSDEELAKLTDEEIVQYFDALKNEYIEKQAKLKVKEPEVKELEEGK